MGRPELADARVESGDDDERRQRFRMPFKN
jgi:hypothetical protein